MCNSVISVNIIKRVRIKATLSASLLSLLAFSPSAFAQSLQITTAPYNALLLLECSDLTPTPQ